MVGRLKPEAEVGQALSDAGQVAEETMRTFPGYMHNLHIRPEVKPLEKATVEQARPLVRMLFLAVVVVLLIACANLAGLLLVRAIRRRREIAVRMALGARTGTLLRQAILESLVLSVTGGVLGLGLAVGTVRLGVSLLPETLPRISEIGLDWQVVGFALGLAVLAGVLCGLAPAFSAARTNVNEALKEGGRTGTIGGGHTRLRSALVIGEIVVAMVLLTASGMLMRSFQRMRAVELAFVPTTLLQYPMLSRETNTQPRLQWMGSTTAYCETFANSPVSRPRASPLCCPLARTITTSR
jgi:predicted lysophospholipase L1 biosynthesis ABC-type transport system permease subunit